MWAGETRAEAGDDASLFNYSYGIIVGACKINTGSVLVLRALSSVFLAATEKHVPSLVMIIHCLTLRLLMSYIYMTAIVNCFQILVDATRTINTADHLASRW